MAWEGRTLGDICRQLKDTSRNGGRDLSMLQEHVAKDDLVAWGNSHFEAHVQRCFLPDFRLAFSASA
jgi:hypothetical protein